MTQSLPSSVSLRSLRWRWSVVPVRFAHVLHELREEEAALSRRTATAGWPVFLRRPTVLLVVWFDELSGLWGVHWCALPSVLTALFLLLIQPFHMEDVMGLFNEKKFCDECGMNIKDAPYHRCFRVLLPIVGERSPGVKYCSGCGHSESRCSRCGRVEGCISCGLYSRCSCFLYP